MLLNYSIKNALISLSNKIHLLKISNMLLDRKINLFSTGGTAKILKKNKIPVIEVSKYTKFPEIMNGRIKTLHPKIIGGILGRRQQDETCMKLHNILPMDIVIVNFYPFDKVSTQEKYNREKIIENIDIGGPTLVRSAAKNYKDVIIIVDLLDLESIIHLINNKDISLEKRFDLAAKAFEYTSNYEKEISKYFTKNNNFKSKCQKQLFPDKIKLNFIKKQNLRYGENQHLQMIIFLNQHLKKNSY